MPHPAIRLLAALLVVLGTLSGCGDDAGEPGGAVGDQGRAAGERGPAAGEPDRATGEPNGEPGSDVPAYGRVTTEALLEALATRVADGRGISDVTWTRDVQEVGMALWPDDASGEHLAARRNHTHLTHIAGDMAGRLAGNETARAEWMASDPSSVHVHDAFVAASRAGVEAYRAWVVGGGRTLLRERIEALQRERPPR